MCNPETWTARYLDVLTDRLGWEARDAGDRIVVSAHGLTMIIANSAPHDPEFLNIIARFPMVEDVDRSTLLTLAGATTRKVKGVYVTIRSESVEFAVDQLTGGSGTLGQADFIVSVLPRLHSMLVAGISRFYAGVDCARQDLEVMRQLDGIEAATAERLREDEAA